jgi:hypothetical protein
VANNILSGILGNLGGNLIRDIQKTPQDSEKALFDTPLFGGLAKGFTQGFTNAVSGKDLSIAGKGSPLEALGHSLFRSYGSRLYNDPHLDQSLPQVQAEMAKNPSFWDRFGAGLNIVGTPAIAKDAAQLSARAALKVLPIPALSRSLGSFAHSPAFGGLPKAVASGSSRLPGVGGPVGKLFGRYGGEADANFAMAKKAFPKMSLDDFNSLEGRHVQDWVGKMAMKVSRGRGGIAPTTRSDLLQSWSKARDVWGDDFKTMSRNMDQFAGNMVKAKNTLRGVEGTIQSLGYHPPKWDNINLVTPDYMSRVRRSSTVFHSPDTSVLDDLMKFGKQVLAQPYDRTAKEFVRTQLNDAVKQVWNLEKQTGHKLAWGHESFVFPEELAGVAHQGHQLAQAPSSVLHHLLGPLSPEVYTNKAKQALTSARLRQTLQDFGLAPQEVIDRISQHNTTGSQPLNIFKASSGQLRSLFGADWPKIKKATELAQDLPFDVSGYGITSLAKRIPGASNIVDKVFGARFGYNPIFQWEKIPTKLWEVSFANGVKPWSKEADKAVGEYLKGEGKNLVDRIVDPETMELQFQGKGLGSATTTKWMMDAKAEGAKVRYGLANFLDHITSAEERVYLKGAYKSLKDQGHNLAQIPVDKQLEYVRQLPIEVLGKADNFAKSLTRYGQGTSPLANTLNTVFFPSLFHLKVAKYALTGTLTRPAVAASITQLVSNLSNWSLSPEGQLWHRQAGFPQSILHAVGSAEPVNVPALTGQSKSPSQEAAGLANPYNIFSPVLQAARGQTGAEIPTTQTPSSNFEVTNPIVANLMTQFGVRQLGQPILEKLGALTPATKYQPSAKSVASETQRVQSGAMPSRQSLATGIRNIKSTPGVLDALGLRPGDPTLAKSYAQMRAKYDFPDDPKKQKKEQDLIMNLWESVKVKGQ